jgi:hypothetical protein
MAKTEHGFLLIADITGYTQYLSESELEHAHEVLQTLLELLIDHTRPPMIISRLAGDAVISYGLQDDFVSGQTFLELIEDTYVAFRRAIERMVLNNTCRCNACANIGGLDLKFFVHHGAFTRQRLDKHDELLGADVILIHRLLKNTVVEKTGFHAYALYTQSAVEKLSIEDVFATMSEHIEEYDHLGAVRTWVQDMHPVWEEKHKTLKIEIPEDGVLFRMEKVYPLQVEKMWDVLTLPDYRALLVFSERQNILKRRGGRTGVGSEYHCFHKNGRITVQTIVDWHPFEQMTTEDTMPVPGVTALIQLKIEPDEGGTRLVMTISKGHGPLLKRTINDLVARRIVPRIFEEGMGDLHARVIEDMRASDEDDR